jgi:hypothetical protein
MQHVGQVHQQRGELSDALKYQQVSEVKEFAKPENAAFTAQMTLKKPH